MAKKEIKPKKPKSDKPSPLIAIRKEINEAILTVTCKDNGDYIDLIIDLDNFDIKSYQRNRSAGGHTYDPLSSYKKELHKILDPAIRKYIPIAYTGHCYFTLIRYFALIQSDRTKVKLAAAKTNEMRPAKTPDNDNIEKIIYDVLNGVVYNDDSQIVENTTKKFYNQDIDKHRTVMEIKIYKEEIQYVVKKVKKI